MTTERVRYAGARGSRGWSRQGELAGLEGQRRGFGVLARSYLGRGRCCEFGVGFRQNVGRGGRCRRLEGWKGLWIGAKSPVR